LDARQRRVRPARDDKVVAAWNGLAISGLCRVGTLLDEPECVEAAENAADLLWRVHVVDGRLRRVSRAGVVGTPAGVLEDHGCVASGFLDLFQATGNSDWLTRAGAILEAALTHFAADDGGFFDTADDAEALVARPRDPSDNASPSGLSSMVHALSAYAAITGSGRHRDAAEAALATVASIAERAPRFAGWSLAAAQSMLDGQIAVAIVGPWDEERDEMAAVARRHPGAVVVVADESDDGIPLLVGRDALDGHPAAYVCRHLVCERPVTTVAELNSVLTG
jgi:uncharacterized protein